MPKFIDHPTIIPAAGNKPKQIEEFFGRVNSEDARISVGTRKDGSDLHELFTLTVNYADER